MTSSIIPELEELDNVLEVLLCDFTAAENDMLQARLSEKEEQREQGGGSIDWCAALDNDGILGCGPHARKLLEEAGRSWDTIIGVGGPYIRALEEKQKPAVGRKWSRPVLSDTSAESLDVRGKVHVEPETEPVKAAKKRRHVIGNEVDNMSECSSITEGSISLTFSAKRLKS
mmetsp:Transcript_53156/g.130288  ORF Transcript_53156/g.130288 Transcript_53156/m.130288 type:complete len:172 (+) Transcript_53156:364-879(+)